MSEQHEKDAAGSVQTYQPAQTAVIFTDSAAAKVKDLLEEEENPSLCLRVFITGGGCSGFQYGFTFVEMDTVGEDDCVVEKTVVAQNPGASDGIVKLVVDPMSLQYLQGATIDYKEDLQGAQFIIHNPNATTTCGCGSSFSA